MHKYMRAIGFSKVKNKAELKEILTDVVVTSTDRSYSILENDEKIAVMSKNISPSLGISVCGEFDDRGNFVYDYHFPYLRSFVKSVEEEIAAERHSSQVSYAGVCEEVNFGVVLIFYLQNFPGYLELKKSGKLNHTYVSLTGLSTNGRIIFPLEKSHTQRKSEKIYAEKRKNLLKEARKGVEDAVESLNMQDMGMYNTICKKIQESDVYSLVDTTFIPCGVESDHYAILGEILHVKNEINMYSNEKIYVLTIECNDIIMDIAINEQDLMGEPVVGRRFKGDIWLQGSVHLPN